MADPQVERQVVVPNAGHSRWAHMDPDRRIEVVGHRIEAEGLDMFALRAGRMHPGEAGFAAESHTESLPTFEPPRRPRRGIPWGIEAAQGDGPVAAAATADLGEEIQDRRLTE
jgi:hypothetical protein